MSEEKKVTICENKINNIIKHNEQLNSSITLELKSYQEDGLDDMSLLILEKQISLLNFIKKLNNNYEKVNKIIEKDKQTGKKTTLKKMKKVEKKGKKKKKSTSSDSSDEEEAKPKKATNKKKAVTDKKKAATDKKKD